MARRKAAAKKPASVQPADAEKPNDQQAQPSETATEAQTVQAATPEPNVIWSSERIYKKVTKDDKPENVEWVAGPTDDDQEGKLKYGNPPENVKIGMDLFPVPDASIQLKGFYLEPAQARRLVLAIPGYKFLKPKG